MKNFKYYGSWFVGTTYSTAIGSNNFRKLKSFLLRAVQGNSSCGVPWHIIIYCNGELIYLRDYSSLRINEKI